MLWTTLGDFFVALSVGSERSLCSLSPPTAGWSLAGPTPAALSVGSERSLRFRRGHSMGATRSMSSWQCLGGSGTSSLAEVMRTSVPQIEQR